MDGQSFFSIIIPAFIMGFYQVEPSVNLTVLCIVQCAGKHLRYIDRISGGYQPLWWCNGRWLNTELSYEYNHDKCC
jgi:hypothetical protein